MKVNKKYVWFLVAVLVLVLSLSGLTTGCAETAPTPTPTPTPPPVQKPFTWPDKLSVVASGTGSMDYAIMTAWTTPLAADTGMQIRMVSEESLLLKNTMVRDGTVFLSGETAPYDCLEAQKQWAARDGGPWKVRYIYTRSLSNVGYAVRGDSNIRTPRDIKPGTRMAHMTISPRGKQLMVALVAWAGLDPEKDIVWVPAATPAANVKALVDGKADVVFTYTAAPATFEAEASPHGIKWVELNAEADPEGAKKSLEVVPTLIYGPMTSGVPSCIGAWGQIGLKGYGTREDSDPELVYHLTKWFDENYDRYKDAHPQGKAGMTIDVFMKMAETDIYPLHDGTVKYLKEKGLWTAANEKRNQQNIAFIDRYIDAYKTAIGMADAKGIEVDPQNSDWLQLWTDYKKQIGLPRYTMFLGLD